MPKPLSNSVSTLDYVWLDSRDWDDSHKSLFFALYKPHPTHRSVFQDNLKIFNTLLWDLRAPERAYGWARGVIKYGVYSSLELQICVSPRFEKQTEAASFFLSAAIAFSSADRIRLCTDVLFENLEARTIHLLSENSAAQMSLFEISPQEWWGTPAGAENSKRLAYLQKRRL